MNIFVLGTIDKKGGAAQTAWELREKFKAEGHTVNTFVRYKYTNEPDVFVIPRKQWQDWLVKLFANDLRFARTDYLLNTKEFKEADIVHCNNLHSNFFNLKTLQKMSKIKPVVWTIQDLWPITGYASDSATRKNPSKKKFFLYLWDTTSHLLAMKRRIYRKTTVHLVAVSEWMKKELKHSILADKPITRIYNGADVDIFKPYDKTTLRKKLGLPVDKKIVAFGLKGWHITQKIIDECKNRDDIYFLAIGHNTVKTENKNYSFVPHIEGRLALADYLGACDIYMHPTFGDSFGIIVAEALACGTPVVTWTADAMPEIVIHKENGYMADFDNWESLLAGINYILNLSKEDYAKMAVRGRERVTKLFTIDRMCREYMELYKKILSRK